MDAIARQLARAIASITLRAQGIAAGTGETREAGLDAERKSPVGEADAPTSQERSHE